MNPRFGSITALLLVAAAPARAQSREAVQREREAFAEWLAASPLSPWRAVVVRPIGTGLSLGPESADIPLAGVPEARLIERDGRAQLRSAEKDTPLPRGRAVALGEWRLVVSGPPGRIAVTVFGAPQAVRKKLSHFAYDPRSAYVVTLSPPRTPGTQRLLAPDGVEVEAGDAGTVVVPFRGAPSALRVMRLPGGTEDESELEIYFRDATAGRGSYPAGRWVSLIPQGNGRYLLDFNRARNPFCAYNTVYPCPSPWRGNTLDRPVRAGERYAGGGFEAPVK